MDSARHGRVLISHRMVASACIRLHLICGEEDNRGVLPRLVPKHAAGVLLDFRDDWYVHRRLCFAAKELLHSFSTLERTPTAVILRDIWLDEAGWPIVHLRMSGGCIGSVEHSKATKYESCPGRSHGLKELIFEQPAMGLHMFITPTTCNRSSFDGSHCSI